MHHPVAPGERPVMRMAMLIMEIRRARTQTTPLPEKCGMDVSPVSAGRFITER